MWKEYPCILPRTVVKFIYYLRHSRPFVDKIYVISQNSRGYNAQFLFRRFLEQRWAPQLIMDGSKILSMDVGTLQFLDLLNYSSMSLRASPNHLTPHARRGTRPNFSTLPTIWIMWALIPNSSSKGETLSGDERTQFSAWYEGLKKKFLTIGTNCWPTA